MFPHERRHYGNDDSPPHTTTTDRSRRPWSPVAQDDFGGDGGAIQRYLQTVGERTPQSNHRSSARSIEGHHFRSGQMEQLQSRQAHDFGNQRQRREVSETSIEALDLADYANSLRQSRRPAPGTIPRHNEEDWLPYPAHPTILPNSPYHYSPQYQQRNLPLPIDDDPRSDRPFSTQNLPSRGNTILAPPSLVSAGVSSGSTQTFSNHHFPPSRRLTVPPRLGAADPAIFSGNIQHQTFSRADNELASFPRWSRPWYEANTKHETQAQVPPTYEADLGIWPSPPPQEPSPYGIYPSPTVHGAMVPWSAETGHSNPRVTESVKEERIRMLEKEFGEEHEKKKHENENPIGTVGPSGSLMTSGPRRRIAARVTQGALAFGAAISSVYGALAIHPSKKPPPKNTGPAYVLYVLSTVTAFAVFYYFAIQPCVRRRRMDKFTGAQNQPGMMVLPIMQDFTSGGKKGKKYGKGKKKGKGHNTGEGVQVNLIVDPSMFGGLSRPRHEDVEEDDEAWVDGSDIGSPRAKRQRRGANSRQNAFATITMEQEWKRARRLLKWTMAFDCLACILWVVGFAYLMWGERCPIGQFEGWCTTYNLASACGFLLFVTFGISIFFDYQDLRATSISPRSRR